MAAEADLGRANIASARAFTNKPGYGIVKLSDDGSSEWIGDKNFDREAVLRHLSGADFWQEAKIFKHRAIGRLVLGKATITGAIDGVAGREFLWSGLLDNPELRLIVLGNPDFGVASIKGYTFIGIFTKEETRWGRLIDVLGRKFEGESDTLFQPYGRGILTTFGPNFDTTAKVGYFEGWHHFISPITFLSGWGGISEDADLLATLFKEPRLNRPLPCN